MAIITQSDLHRDCLNKLGRALDLVLKMAEATSAAGDHKNQISTRWPAKRIVSLRCAKFVRRLPVMAARRQVC
jgi:hypothetical protein